MNWDTGASSAPAHEKFRTDTPDAVQESSVLTGEVVGEDGLPVSGAVVVTSAGGQAVTGEDGSFELEFTLPPGTSTVQLSAVANGSPSSFVGSRRVGGLVPGRTEEGATISLSQATGCQPEWLPTFGALPGLSNNVRDMVVYDDGSGPALYVGGGFGIAGSVVAHGIAKWDGTAWSALGSGSD
jgi:hypothetical protein